MSATLRRHLPGYDPLNGREVTLDAPLSVADLCRQLGIPTDQVKIVMVNGKHASQDHMLQGDERVALFPPVGGG
ncbi:MAG: MoaD/ThiS family protein [Deltaproteobacteria bacterium]|nr:MoaD/ThiS family protein [Deltaproteobacteria bacterium]